MKLIDPKKSQGQPEITGWLNSLRSAIRHLRDSLLVFGGLVAIFSWDLREKLFRKFSRRGRLFK